MILKSISSAVKRQRFFIVLVLLLSLSLVMMEVIVRLTVTAPTAEVFHETLGFQERPFARICNTREGYASFTLDAFGFNNDPLPVQMPKQRYLVVGDSFVQSYQLNRPYNFSYLLSEGLGENTLVYNAGVSGFDPTRFSLLVNELAPILKPTRLLLVVTSSDLYDMLKWDVLEDEAGVIQGFNWNYVEMTPFRKWKMEVYSSSALISLLKRKYQSLIEAWWEDLDAFDRQGVEKRTSSFDPDTERLRRFRFAMESLVKQNIPISILFLPVFSYGHQGAYVKPENDLTKLEQLSMSMGLDTINVEQAFRDSFKQGAQPAIGFHNSRVGYGHLNALGHQLVASVLLKHFRQLGYEGGN